MSNYRRGAQRENEWADRKEKNGWVVTRSAGSHGSMDVTAALHGVIHYYQVKSDRGGPYRHFGPDERRELLDDATRAGALAFLVWWPPDRRGPRVIPPEDWPPTP